LTPDARLNTDDIPAIISVEIGSDQVDQVTDNTPKVSNGSSSALEVGQASLTPVPSIAHRTLSWSTTETRMDEQQEPLAFPSNALSPNEFEAIVDSIKLEMQELQSSKAPQEEIALAPASKSNTEDAAIVSDEMISDKVDDSQDNTPKVTAMADTLEGSDVTGSSDATPDKLSAIEPPPECEAASSEAVCESQNDSQAATKVTEDLTVNHYKDTNNESQHSAAVTKHELQEEDGFSEENFQEPLAVAIAEVEGGEVNQCLDSVALDSETTAYHGKQHETKIIIATQESKQEDVTTLLETNNAVDLEATTGSDVQMERPTPELMKLETETEVFPTAAHEIEEEPEKAGAMRVDAQEREIDFANETDQISLDSVAITASEGASQSLDMESTESEVKMISITEATTQHNLEAISFEQDYPAESTTNTDLETLSNEIVEGATIQDDKEGTERNQSANFDAKESNLPIECDKVGAKDTLGLQYDHLPVEPPASEQILVAQDSNKGNAVVTSADIEANAEDTTHDKCLTGDKQEISCTTTAQTNDIPLEDISGAESKDEKQKDTEKEFLDKVSMVQTEKLLTGSLEGPTPSSLQPEAEMENQWLVLINNVSSAVAGKEVFNAAERIRLNERLHQISKSLMPVAAPYLPENFKEPVAPDLREENADNLTPNYYRLILKEILKEVM